MRKKEELIFAVDLGSENFRLACALPKSPSKVEVVELKEVSSAGMGRGIVKDINPALERLKKLFREMEKSLGRKIEEVVANISGSHLSLTFSKGEVAVSRADQEISQEDAERALESAQAVSLGQNQEALSFYPLGFRADGSELVKDPVAMKGRKLEAEILIFSGFSPFVKNYYSLFEELGVDLIDLIPSALASAESVLDRQEKELGVALVDIGALTTDVIVFEEGNPTLLFALPVGSSHITRDLAVLLPADIEVAERIKIEHGQCVYVKSKKKIEIVLDKEDEEQKKISFSQNEVSKIIIARVSQIFKAIQKKLKEEQKLKNLPSGVILTGGGSKLKGIEKIAQKELKLSVRLGQPKEKRFLNFTSDPSYSTLTGLLLLAQKNREEMVEEKVSLIQKLKEWFKNFIP